MSASASGVEATLSRDSKGILSLNLEETFSENREPLAGRSIEEALELIQRREMDHVYRTLSDIREQLSAQVNSVGDDIPGVTRNVTTDEQRVWRVNADHIRIAGFATTTDEQLSGPEDASEASLLRATFNLIIADRLEAIRDIYEHLSRDILNRQRSTTARILDADFPSRQTRDLA